MSRIALFPGSFDPFTIGHQDIVERALPLFDRIIIGIGHNAHKQYLTPLEERIAAIDRLFGDESRITVKSYQGLTVDCCKEENAGFIIRGLRSGADLAYEMPIAQMNRSMAGIDTVFLTSAPEHSAISSTIVRDIIRHGGDASRFLP